MTGATPPLILVVDDQEADRIALRAILESGGFAVTTAASVAEARRRLAGDPQPDAALLDVYLPDGTGLELLDLIQVHHAGLPAVMISGQGDIATALEATRHGAFDFLEKPPRAQHLLLRLRHALELTRLTRENRVLREQAGRSTHMVVASAAMRALLEQVRRVAPRRTPVLIVGESGTGKEEIARRLHAESPDAAGPWVAFNAAAVPEELAESTLFGHEKGAFTSAAARHHGLFEQAHGGTLFLDEVGEMPPRLQARLLRVIEDPRIRRVGGEREISVRVRLLAATNRDLEAATREGRFRLDLYHRLAVIRLAVPPLRERREEVVALARHFLEAFAARERIAPRTLDRSAIAFLERQPWPGNVREVRNLIERALILTSSEPLTDADLEGVSAPLPTPGEAGGHGGRPGEPAGADSGNRYTFSVERGATLEEALHQSERRHLAEALDATDWNVARAAERLGIDRSHCHRKIRAHGLQRPPRPGR